MRMYKLRPEWKKSALDLEHWSKEIDGKKIWIQREVGWRWAECTFQSEDPPEIDLKNEHGYSLEDLDIVDYYADDGCWTTFYFPETVLTEEQKEVIEDMDYSDLEEDGWVHEDTETYFTGPLILEDVTDEK